MNLSDARDAPCCTMHWSKRYRICHGSAEIVVALGYELEWLDSPDGFDNFPSTGWTKNLECDCEILEADDQGAALYFVLFGDPKPFIGIERPPTPPRTDGKLAQVIPFPRCYSKNGVGS